MRGRGGVFHLFVSLWGRPDPTSTRTRRRIAAFSPPSLLYPSRYFPRFRRSWYKGRPIACAPRCNQPACLAWDGRPWARGQKTCPTGPAEAHARRPRFAALSARTVILFPPGPCLIIIPRFRGIGDTQRRKGTCLDREDEHPLSCPSLPPLTPFVHPPSSEGIRGRCPHGVYRVALLAAALHGWGVAGAHGPQWSRRLGRGTRHRRPLGGVRRGGRGDVIPGIRDCVWPGLSLRGGPHRRRPLLAALLSDVHRSLREGPCSPT